MNPFIQLRQTSSVFLAAFTLACFGLLPSAQAVSPTPDGCYPGYTTAEGCDALSLLTTGLGNTGLGWRSLFLDTTGNFNTGVGGGALVLNNGDSNTAVGAAAMLLNTTGTENVGIGTDALVYNAIASFNCAVGSFTLFKNDSSGHGTAKFNTAVGSEALEFNVDGAANTAVGLQALSANQADGLTAVGADALFANVIATANTAVGDLALVNNDFTAHGVGNDNTAVGSGALFGNIDAAANTAVGSEALSFNDQTGHGLANDNTAVGASALLHNIDADGNTALGYAALKNNDSTGHGFAVLNTAVGDGALFSNTDGAENTVVGAEAGQNILTGGDNTYLGRGVGFLLPDESNTVRIADNLPVTTNASNCYIGGIANQFTGNIFNSASVFIDLTTNKLGTSPSSERFKKDIDPMDKTSEVIFSLKPVTFRYKNDKSNTPCFGLIAEDVAKVNPALAAWDKEGKPYTVRYEAVNAMLLNEFLKAHTKIEQQQLSIAELKSAVTQQRQRLESRIAEQQKQIDALTAGLQKVSAQLELSKAAPQTVLNNQ